MAVPAVAAALSKFNDTLSSSPCGADEQVEELVSELTWMLSFLVDGEKTPQGQARTDVWSSAIQRLAVYAQELQSGAGDGALRCREIDYLNKSLASLREKIQPFIISCQLHSADSCQSATITDPPVPTVVQIPKEIQIDAWGGSGGSNWDFKVKGAVKQINIAYGALIDSITFTCMSTDGKMEAPVKIGGTGGFTTKQVNINGPSEYLTGISGTYGIFNGWNAIKSLKFKTNVTSYGPYGSFDGTPFSFSIKEGKIIRFHGRSGVVLDAIGVYVTSV